MNNCNSEILEQLVTLSEKIISSFYKYKNGQIIEEDLIDIVQNLTPSIEKLYFEATDFNCEDDSDKHQEIYAAIHDMTLYYSKKGLKIWNKENREWLINNAIDRLKNFIT